MYVFTVETKCIFPNGKIVERIYEGCPCRETLQTKLRTLIIKGYWEKNLDNLTTDQIMSTPFKNITLESLYIVDYYNVLNYVYKFSLDLKRLLHIDCTIKEDKNGLVVKGHPAEVWYILHSAILYVRAMHVYDQTTTSVKSFFEYLREKTYSYDIWFYEFDKEWTLLFYEKIINGEITGINYALFDSENGILENLYLEGV